MMNWLGHAILCAHTTVTTFTMAITMMHSYWTEKGRGKQLTKEERYDIILVADDHATVNVLRMKSLQMVPTEDWNSRIFWGTTPRPPIHWSIITIHAFLSSQSTNSYETPMTYFNVWRLVQCWRAPATAWAPAAPMLFTSRLYMNNKTQQIITICDPGVT